MKKRYFLGFLALVLSTMVSCGSDDKSSDEACNNADDVRCHEGRPQKCIDHTWTDQTPCGKNQTCDAGQCVDNSSPHNDCAANAVQCSYSGVPQKCSNGEWIDQDNCKTGEQCVDGKCIVCKENAIQCSDTDVPQICKDGHWVNQAACEGEEVCSGGKCAKPITLVCLDNTMRCSETGRPQICKNNAWEDDTACSDDRECKDDGRCVLKDLPECGETAKQCSDAGVPQICEEGHWKDQTACDASSRCQDGKCIKKEVPECFGTQTQCSASGVPQNCNDGKWQDLNACPDGWSCLEADGHCYPSYLPECSAERRCSASGLPMTCKDFKWVTESACAQGEKCLDGYCVPLETPECEEGVWICGDLSECMVCKNGQWESGGECNDSEICMNGLCVDLEQNIDYLMSMDKCEDGETTCEGAKLKYCVNETWKTRFCDPNNRCVDGACVSYTVPDCTNGKKRCTTNGIPEICKNNHWERSDNLCDAGSEICRDGDCVPSCDPAECKLKRGDDYLGNICIESGFAGTTCGCETDADCKDRYKCNQIVGFCAPENAASYTEFSLHMPSSATCDGFHEANNLLDCTQTGKTFNLTFANYAEAEISASNIASGMANLKTPASDYYVKLSNIIPSGDPWEHTAEFVWQQGSSENTWTNNQLKVSSGDKSKNYTAVLQNEDMTSNFILEEDEVSFEATGSKVVKLKSILVRDRLETDEHVKSQAACKDASSRFYYGDKCLDTSCNLCGCLENADCKTGYHCDVEFRRCIDPRNAECDAVTDNYLGSFYDDVYRRCICAPLWNQDTNSYDNANATCKEGYTCSPFLECAKTSPKVFTLDFTQTPNSCEKLMSIPGTKRCDMSTITATDHTTQDNIITLTLENLVEIQMFQSSMYYEREITDIDTNVTTNTTRPGYFSDYQGRYLILTHLEKTDIIEVHWYVDGDPGIRYAGETDPLVVESNKYTLYQSNGWFKPVTTTFQANSNVVTIKSLLNALMPHEYLYIDSITITRQ